MNVDGGGGYGYGSGPAVGGGGWGCAGARAGDRIELVEVKTDNGVASIVSGGTMVVEETEAGRGWKTGAAMGVKWGSAGEACKGRNGGFECLRRD